MVLSDLGEGEWRLCMKQKTMKPLNEQRHIVAYLDGLHPDGHLRRAKVNAFREVQSQGQEELGALLPPPTGMIPVLDRAFKGEL